jgi:hypothetical protein
MITPEKFIEMKTLQEKCNTYLKETTLPIKRQHSENVEKYLNNFIKFPGALSIVSVFFVSSDLVKNPIFALIGIIFIIISLLISLNAMRKSVSNDFYFYKKIEMTEKPMVFFSRKLTQFSRNQLEEKELIISYDKLQDSYRKNSTEENVEDEKYDILDFTKNSINISFVFLIIGIIFCFFSTINITYILKLI